ncbi:protein NRT1/ PTR FAMILY 5.4-like [Malania oleifera]|uniref:protein NRT1/ PTR FAMILY 5.4-like n=1 Tax=Malania oleifera TaxID=397392 RepID=UPI0025AE5386|nr:protein NRT1/ PTR FAMILY 5.4-like [Malania oleifera]
MDSSVTPVMNINENEEQNTSVLNGVASPPRHNPNKGGWKSAIFIISVETAERFSYYGVAGNLITYLTTGLHEPLATAAKNVNTWVGVSSLFPLLGAFVADSYLGRFRTILISSVIYLAGLILLTVSVTAAVPVGSRAAVFYVALYILAVGEGGHKPCVQTFAADQFDEDLPEEKKAKSSFFNWWYMGVVIGATTAVLVVVYVEDYVGWAVGFAMPTAAVMIALVLFLAGIRRYRRQRPVGSPFTRTAQVFVAAARKRRVIGTLDEARGFGVNEEAVVRTLARTHQFRFLDKAAIPDDVDKSSKTRNPWRLCSQTQVEEVKLVLRLVPVWLACFTFAIATAQMSTFFTKQGATLRRSIGHFHHIPPASLQVFAGATILLSVPAYDSLLVPFLRSRVTRHPSGLSILQRMGFGMLLSAATMAVAALVESRRLAVARSHGLLDSPKATVPMAVWWLVPQYALCGLSDMFTVVGMQELFYDQVPEEMRSVGAALHISTVGVGNFMSRAVISAVQAATAASPGGKWLGDNLNRAHLDGFYWVLAVMSGVNLCVFVAVARGFVYKKVAAEKEMDLVSDDI